MSEIAFPLKHKYYRHLLWFLVLPAYLLLFKVAESLVVTDYWVSYMPIDDWIPFCEWFAPAYFIWYPFVFCMGAYLAWRHSGDFRRYALYILVGFFSALIFCILVPNGQDLRPAVMPRDNLMTRILVFIYKADTNTNVLPSMHVIGALGVCIAAYENPYLKRRRSLPVRLLLDFVAILICVSTVFVKQHSLLDTLVGIPWSVATWAVVYLPGRKKRKQQQALESAAAGVV